MTSRKQRLSRDCNNKFVELQHATWRNYRQARITMQNAHAAYKAHTGKLWKPVQGDTRD